MVYTYCFPLCDQYTVILIRASIPRICVFLKKGLGKPRAGREEGLVYIDRSSLIFSGFWNSAVSFRLTARGGGEHLAYCIAFGIFRYFATLTQFSGKVGFAWLRRFGVSRAPVVKWEPRREITAGSYECYTVSVDAGERIVEWTVYERLYVRPRETVELWFCLSHPRDVESSREL